MKTLMVCVSPSHGNTARVAQAIAEVLDAQIVEPEVVDAAAIAAADLVGFGSGIYGMRFHARLRDLVERLPPGEGKPVFVFATSGGPELPLIPFTGPLVGRLEAKGYDIVGRFTCRGWDTWLPLQLVGGLNKGRPNSTDLDAARAFAGSVRKRIESRTAGS